MKTIKYQEKTEILAGEADQKGVTIEEKWQRIKKIVHEAIIKKKVKTKRFELGHKDWWNGSYIRKKREYIGYREHIHT